MTNYIRRSRSRLAPQTAVRAYRLERGITLAEVALQSGVTSFRLSIIERNPERAKPGEIEAHRRAVDELAAVRVAA